MNDKPSIDHSGQVVQNSQTNIAGDVQGPVFSGQFQGPFIYKEAAQLRLPLQKPPRVQHFTGRKRSLRRSLKICSPARWSPSAVQAAWARQPWPRKLSGSLRQETIHPKDSRMASSFIPSTTSLRRLRPWRPSPGLMAKIPAKTLWKRPREPWQADMLSSSWMERKHVMTCKQSSASPQAAECS